MQNDPRLGTTGGPAPLLSVIVLAYRNEDTVLRAVASLLDQRTRQPYEVIVVASGGGRCAQLVRDTYPEIRVLEFARRLFPGAARNAGVEAARGEVVSFLAADCLAEPSWIEKRTEAHRRGYQAVASSVTNAGPFTPWGWAFYFLLYTARTDAQPARLLIEAEPAAHGLSFDVELLRRLGPFSDVRIGEDTDMADRLRAAGVAIWLEPEIRTAHFGPSTPLQMLRDLFHRGQRRAAATSHSAGDRSFVSLAQASLRRVRSAAHALGNENRYTVDSRATRAWLYGGSFAYHLGWFIGEKLCRRDS